MTTTNDKQICNELGLTVDEVDEIVAKVETGDLSDYDTSRVMVGRPLEKKPMDTISLKIPRSRIQAVNRMAREAGVSRSEFVRRAIDNELITASRVFRRGVTPAA
ncbi:ribbon-helix-helix protein, CopG family [Adlercreutzia sp. ZJ138]|uniref:ribbon-helix-helix protein, CopG family n=1 Tax=Adlercreutzia sp. ZJ138 TaxID=2709405 RepID=UPI0013EB22F3|nr:ribbon-helix-helix protein, CopG family [Adlercreutzia sp. ZJ138]